MSSIYSEWLDQNVKAKADFFASLKLENIAEDFKGLKKPVKKEKLADDEGPLRKSPRLKELEKDNDKPWQANWMEDCATKTDCARNVMLSKLTQCAAKFKKTLKKSSCADHGSFRIENATSVTGASSLISSVAVHPGSETVLAAIGNDNGQITFAVQQKSDDEIIHRKFQVHDEGPITALAFDREHLLSVAKDGTLRRLFLRNSKLGFQEIYSNGLSGWKRRISGMAVSYRSDGFFEHDMWLCQGNGCLVRLDSREGSRGSGASTYHISEASLNSVAWCPSSNLLCSAARDGTVAIWDPRCIPNSPEEAPLAAWEAGFAMSSLLCNPFDPTLILAANRINFNVSLLKCCPKTPQLSELSSINLLDVPVFSKPTWHPTLKDVFVIGGRGCKIKTCFAPNGIISKKCHDLNHPNITATQYVCTFHPTRSLIVGVSEASATISFIYLEPLLTLDFQQADV